MEKLFPFNPNTLNIENPLLFPLCHFFEVQTTREPDSIALVFGNDILTYGDLNERINQVAHFLIEKGVGPETVVGVCFERSFEMIIAIYAIIKAGGVYVPVDPYYPESRLQFVASDSESMMILSHKPCAKIAKSLSDVIFIDSLEEDLKKFPRNNPRVNIKPENAAYLIYTSGSTGKPKGVINTHLGIVNRLMWMQEYMKLNSGDAVLQKTTYSFDVSVWEFFWPLMTGARLVIAKPDGHKDPNYLAEIIEKESITTIHFVPSMFRIFLSEESSKRCRSLRQVICSGEALDVDSVNKFHSLHKCKLYNLYGPTEAAVDVSFWECVPNDTGKPIPIGKAISNVRLYVLDNYMKKVPPETQGELYIGGIGVARGYCNRPELTKDRFVSDPFKEGPGNTLYKTGDICSMSEDGIIHYFGRVDDQVKIHGMRIELGEIEAVMRQVPGINEVAVAVKSTPSIQELLVGYFSHVDISKSTEEIRQFLISRLPEHMIPQRFIQLDSLPYTGSGKIDKKELPDPDQKRPQLGYDYCAPDSDTEKNIELIWRDLLGFTEVGVNDNLFDLGGNSIIVLKICTALGNRYSKEIPAVKLFQYPTIRTLAAYIDNENISALNQKVAKRISAINNSRKKSDNRVAIIGLAGRYPGADCIDQFWSNLCNGIETITLFSDEDIDNEVDIELRKNPNYVKARGIINDADKFDAAFFGISPHEAEVMDPQHRVFLELAWTALENAGHSSDSYNGNIGVYAGVGDNYYYANHVLPNTRLVKLVGKFMASYGNEKDYISTRVSYKLNCKGPGVSVNTGCSTSLLAVDLAYRALLDNECDMALAGGVDIHVPQRSGQLYQEGGVFSHDGHCRPFDADATGTMFCDGAGIVVLKRYEDAIADGNTIYAVISGCAKNNDGSEKVSFLAPSVDGQAEVIALAQANAGISADQISYVEAHGTGTPMGDPIEVEALTRAFRLSTEKKQFCGLGSVKGHVGHPTIASGVTGLIKAALCLFHEKIPQTLHYKKPNPHINFQHTPFYVVDKLQQWPRTNKKRIAGVSSFGFGGTNVHAIVEETPVKAISAGSRRKQFLLRFTAKSEAALQRISDNFKSFLKSNPNTDLADASYTLQTGRAEFAYRKFIVCSDYQDAITLLCGADPIRSGSGVYKNSTPQIAFLFPGQGSQYVNMGKSLYRDEIVFRESVDRCSEILLTHIGRDIRELLFPAPGDQATAEISLKETRYTQPAIFIIEYSLAQLWKSWGIIPWAMIGHSIGEFVCACLAEVFSLEDALKLVATRGRLMQDLPQGMMLSVRMNYDALLEQLPSSISVAAVNGPELCVVAGPTESVTVFAESMEKNGIVCRALHSSHAFHSAMMDPVVEPFKNYVSKISLSSPKIPFVSTVSGTWINATEATDPSYWAAHLRSPVKFSQAVAEIIKVSPLVLLEVGPRSTSATLVRQQITDHSKHTAIASLSDTYNNEAEWTSLLRAMGMLWLWGVNIDHDMFNNGEKRMRIPLPAYPFEKKRYWIDYEKKLSNQVVRDYNSYITEEDIMAENSSDQMNPRSYVSDKIVKLIEEISGNPIPESSFKLSFLDLGLDSLLLTQIARAVTIEIGIEIAFRQLMEKFTSVDLLVDYLILNMPKEKLDSMLPRAKTSGPVQKSARKIEAIAESTSQTIHQSESVSGTLEKVVIRQMDIIERLLKLLETGVNVNVSSIRAAVSGQTDSDIVKVASSSNSEEVKIINNSGVMNMEHPPVPGARLGRDESGNPAWFTVDPQNKDNFIKIG